MRHIDEYMIKRLMWVKKKSTEYMTKYRGWKAAPAAPRRRDVSRRSNVAQQVHAASSRF